jgi:hypothetical protein
MTRFALAAAAMLLALAPALALDGPPGMHDPSTVIEANGKFYVYATVARDGETVTVGDAPLVWHALDTTNYNVNLYHFAYALNKPTSNVLFWAVTRVEVPHEIRNVRLAIGSNAASIWWPNGQEVIGIYGDRQAVIDDGVSKRVTLNKGLNTIRAAVVNAGGATDFCAASGRSLDNRITQALELIEALAIGIDGKQMRRRTISSCERTYAAALSHPSCGLRSGRWRWPVFDFSLCDQTRFSASPSSCDASPT